MRLNDWRLEFDLPVREFLSDSWNSTMTQSGTHYVITPPAERNHTITPAGSAILGFRGVLIGVYSPPSNCLINGQSCT